MSKIIYFRGYPGVGKSTTARALGKEMNLPVIDYDNVKANLVEHLEQPELAKASYDIAINILDTNAKIGQDIIFDGTGYHLQAFERCAGIVGEENIIVVSCTCSDEDVWKKNFAGRENQKSQGFSFERAKDSMPKMEALDHKYIVVVDSVNPLEENIQIIKEYIKNHR